MSTSTFGRQPVRIIREWKSYAPTELPLSVSVMRSVNANRQRIFQALTVPEYIETWFAAPGALLGSTAVFAREGFFSISYADTRGEQIRIFCSYKAIRRSKLLFTWRNETTSDRIPSLVKIRLLGDFGRTTVHVTHVGMAQSEQQWHEDLWNVSLKNLSNLLLG